MLSLIIYTVIISQSVQFIITQEIFESDVNIRIDAGTRTCIFEKAKSSQVMEFNYQVLDGRHGEFDISVDVFDPKGNKILSDHKKSHNSVIIDLQYDGDYVFCLDNTHSLINSKLVFFYVGLENKENEEGTEAEADNKKGEEHKEEEIVEWLGTYDNGESYTITVSSIIESVSRTLQHIVKARQMLNMYSATKTRDSYLALEDTFIVDLWSSFQITLMLCVGLLQVYMIKSLFTSKHNI